MDTKVMMVLVMLMVMCMSSSAVAGGSVLMFGDRTECEPHEKNERAGAKSYHRDGFVFGPCKVNECEDGYTKDGNNCVKNSSGSSGSDPEPCNVNDKNDLRMINAAAVTGTKPDCTITKCKDGFRLYENFCFGPERMLPGDELKKGESIKSSNGKYKLVFQEDGKLVVYENGDAMWATDKPGEKVIFQEDGNLVVYDANGDSVWASGTQNKDAKSVLLDDDGIIHIFPIFGTSLWHSTDRRYLNFIYGKYGDDKCDEGDRTLVDDIRVGGGGETVRICATENVGDAPAVTEVRSNKDNCPGGWNTVSLRGMRDDIDLRKGKGGDAIRLCFKKDKPGAKNIVFIKDSSSGDDRLKACDEGQVSIVPAGHNIMDGTGGSASYFRVCADE